MPSDKEEMRRWLLPLHGTNFTCFCWPWGGEDYAHFAQGHPQEVPLISPPAPSLTPRPPYQKVMIMLLPTITCTSISIAMTSLHTLACSHKRSKF